MAGMRASVVGNRASGEGEPYPHEAHVTDAALVTRKCRTRDALYSTTALNDGVGGGEQHRYQGKYGDLSRHRVHVHGRAGANAALHPSWPVPTLVRQAQGSNGPLRLHNTDDASHAGTGS
jgi:hypothetical protein